LADIAVISGGGADAPQSDPVSSFSFEGVHEKAMAYGEETPAAAEPVAEQLDATPAAEPVADPSAAGAESTNIDNASNAQLAKLSDDSLVEITVDGQTVQMPWKDAKGGFQRQAHYTKSMQTLRQEQQAFESERQALQQAREEHGVLVNLLKSPEMLQQFIARQYPQLAQQAAVIQQAAQNVDPGDIATVGQIQEAQAQLIAQQQQMQEQFMQELAAREETLTRTIEDRQATAKLSAEINTTIKGLFNEHPYIGKLIPNADQLLRYEVLQMKPGTHEEAVDAFKTVFGGWVENFKSTVSEQNKSTVLAKQKLVKNNIQPPGGAPPQQPPTDFKKVNKMTGKTEVDWDRIRSAALERMNRA
jgi:hypothetical protein